MDGERKCWNCDASPNPDNDFWDLDGVPMTSWSCPKCGDSWRDYIDEQDRELAAVKREIARVKGRLARVLRYAARVSMKHRAREVYATGYTRVWSSRRTGGKQ